MLHHRSTPGRAGKRRSKVLALLGLIGLLTVVLPATPASAASFVRIEGDGSSFAYPAIAQWSKDVVSRGIHIDYAPDGSAAGRQNYIQDQADFAGTDIQFLTHPDPFGGGIENSSYAYSYVPITAGGTAFLYNLTVGGRRITDLRLSGQTIASIFTGKITNWDDKAITKDYGAKLPSQPITVVTRSDGSGASYQFSRYLSKQYPATWSAFCARQNQRGNCGPTEFFPAFNGSQQRNGSDQVASYVHTYEGAIGYDEYSYALGIGQPVVKVLNAAGYYAQPTASNVAIALQAAQINENPKSVDFLIQNLDRVYTNRDPRAYPVSSYSYLVVPRDSRLGSPNGPPPRFNAAKGHTLSTWLNYVLCGAQQSAGTLGYSPLPKNLVQGGFRQVLHIPGHTSVPNLKTLPGCNNPTYSNGVNHLVVDAPQPSPCDKIGSPLNCVVVGKKAKSGGQQVAGTGNHSGGINSGVPNSVSGGSGGGSSGGSGGSTSGGGAATTGGGTSTNTQVDPVTGQVVTSGGSNSSNSSQDAASAAYAVPTQLGGGGGGKVLFSILTALELIAAVIVPAGLGIWITRRRRLSE